MSQIHQEVRIEAPVAKVYKALTDSQEFASFTGAPTQIEAQDGGAFTCFGTAISGRNVELVAGERIVQAWRVFDWLPGHYSMVRFQLKANGETTTLVLDQDGVPEEVASHVDPGWHEKYWKPLKSHLEK